MDATDRLDVASAKHLAVSAAQREVLARMQARGTDIAAHGLRIAGAVEATVIKLHAAIDIDRDGLKILRQRDGRNVVSRFLRPVEKLTDEQREAVSGLAWAFAGIQSVKLFMETVDQQNEQEHCDV